MTKFQKRCQGAVSLFLVIILLPTLTIAGIFVDIARVKLGEEVATTSADLALNTVLSYYDTDLKDYFGLLASCQDTESAIEVSKEYFVASMVSAGVDTDTALTYVNNIISSFVTEDDDVTDFLQLSVDGDVTITATENGALDNPALLKTQIVEFMKYRAPINGIASLLEKLKESSSTLENASKETELTEKKQAFYEAEEALIKQAEVAYKAIKKYTDYSATINGTSYKISSEDLLNSFSEFLATPYNNKSMEENFKSAHTLMVKNLYNTHDSSGTNAKTLLTSKTITSQSESTTYSESNQASASQIQKLIETLNTAVTTYCTKKAALQTAYETVGSKESSDYDIQYWVALTSAVSTQYAAYKTAAESVWSAYLKLENAVENAAENAMDETMTTPTSSYVTYGTGEQTLQSIYSALSSYYTSKIKSEVTGSGSDTFKKISQLCSKLNTTENQNKLNLSTVTYIYTISNRLSGYYDAFNEAASLAKKAKEETAKLTNLLKTYQSALEAWKSLAYDDALSSSSLAEQDKKTIEELEKEGAPFTADAVTELVNRLSNIYEVCSTFATDIKAIKYNSTSVLNVTNYTKFRSAASLDTSKIVRNESELESYAESSFSFTIGTAIQNIKTSSGTSSSLKSGDTYTITDSYHLYLEKTSLELWTWMKNKFGGTTSTASLSASTSGYDVSDESSAESARNDIEDKGDSTEDTKSTAAGKSFSEWSGATLPTSSSSTTVESLTFSSAIESISTYVSNLFSDFTGTVGSSVVNVRDDLYTIDYIMSMFTWETFDYEGCYSLLTESQQKKITYENFSDYYTSTIKSSWTSSNDIKTLTLTTRSTSNNWAYGAEVEYILYGNTSNDKNLSSAHAQIYAIRYACDLAPVFNKYWEDTTVKAVANALQAFAYIPAGLTKTLICLAITAAEASEDLKTLQKGIPVALVKEKSELFCSYKSVFLGSSASRKTSSGLTLSYSDYLKIFLFIKLTANENPIYLRTADVIQANFSLSTDDFTFALSKSQVYFDLTATVLVEPMWSRLLAIDNLGDLSTSTSWRTISVSMRRGY